MKWLLLLSMLAGRWCYWADYLVLVGSKFGVLIVVLVLVSSWVFDRIELGVFVEFDDAVVVVAGDIGVGGIGVWSDCGTELCCS